MSQPDLAAEIPERIGDWEAARRQLDGWLASLADYDDQAPPGVVERIRADYRRRLGEIAAEAAARAESLRAALAASVRAAETANDRRLELRLRYLVGEVDAGALDAGLVEQEALITTATAEREQIQAVMPALDAFSESMRALLPAVTVPAVVPQPAADELGFLSQLPVSAPAQVAAAPAAAGAQSGAIAAAPVGAVGGVTLSAALPRTQLRCRQCGVPNDPGLWYCDGCGAELT